MTLSSPDALIGRLASDSFAIAENYFDYHLCAALQLEAEALAFDPLAIDAGTGRGAGRTADTGVRRTRIAWIDRVTPAQIEFSREVERLQVALNRQLFLGLGACEAQLALTPVGGFYARHLDSFQGRRNRIVSLVVYLNSDWLPADGGCLRIFPPIAAQGPSRSGNSIDVTPERATLVLMLSEDVPHEVLPSHRVRASIAGWFATT